MSRKLYFILATLTVVSVAAFFGVRGWRARVVHLQEQRAFQAATNLLQSGRGVEALAVTQAHRQPGSGLDWAAVEFEALVATMQVPRLSLIFQREPARILHHEEASLLLARALFSGRKPEDYQKIRQAWRGREIQAHLWLALDADTLMLAGKAGDAERLLRASQFKGDAESIRLSRLALLTAKRDLKGAYELLDEASRLNPRDPDIRSFRGQILEAIGKPSLARVEYVAALVADPRNPLRRDQLAEFYRRQGDYDLALRTWQDALTAPTVDFIWVKTLFWSRVVQPVSLDTNKTSVPAGELQPLVQWFLALSPGQFFDNDSLAQLPAARRFTQERQELFWLQLIGELKARRETNAVELLNFNRFKTMSWQPSLQTALQRILYYRAKHSLNPPDLIISTVATNQHEFFAVLEAAARRERATKNAELPASIEALLRGPDAFAAAFLAAGWRETALELRSRSDASADAPEWFHYGMTQVLRFNRSPGDALKYLRRLKPSPLLELLAAELLLADGKIREGLNRLSPLAVQDSDAGYRAAWLLALANMDQQRFEEARTNVMRQPRLASSVAGQELFARIDSLEGRVADAESRYRLIATQSTEARAFLARLAFAGKDWPAARRYTAELTALLPEEMQLRENLRAIEKAEAGK